MILQEEKILDLEGLHRPESILVLSHSERHSVLDRRNLRRLGLPDPQQLSNGVVAARHIQAHGADLILCDDVLEDMKGTELVRILRLHPDHVHTPVLTLSTVHSRKALARAAMAGASGFLVRPYSMPSLARQVRLSLEQAAEGSTMGRFVPDAAMGHRQEPSHQAFEQALAALEKRKEEPDHGYLALKRGMEMFRTGRFSQAMEDFQRALAHRPRMVEAQHGMAMCWKELGYPAKHRHWLERTCESLLLSGREREAARVMTRLARLHDPGTNLRRHIAQGLVRRGDFRNAAHIFEQCLEREGDGKELFAAMARSCMFTDNPSQAARMLSKELLRTPSFAREKDLFERIMGMGRSLGQGVTSQETRETGHGPMSKLRDLVAVAGYTWKVYRQQGAA